MTHSAFRDRTGEFEAISSRFSGKPVQLNDLKKPENAFIQATDALAARLVVFQRLVDRLNSLVSRRTLYYGNVTPEIDEVSALFARETKELEGELNAVSQWVQNQPSSRHQRLHGVEVLKEIHNRKSRLSKKFQEGLKSRTQVLQEKVVHHEAYGQSAMRKPKLDLGAPLFTMPHTVDPSTPQSRTTTQSQPPVQEVPIVRPTGVRRRHKTNIPQSSPSSFPQPYPDSRMQLQQQQVLLQEEEEEKQKKAALGRLQYAESIEHEIEKLSQVFQRFTAMLTEQGEAIRLIDQDVELAGLQVEEGHSHIVKTYSIVKGNRSLILKIFAVIIFLAVVLVVF